MKRQREKPIVGSHADERERLSKALKQGEDFYESEKYKAAKAYIKKRRLKVKAVRHGS